jgi:hypothetical protein
MLICLYIYLYMSIAQQILFNVRCMIKDLSTNKWDKFKFHFEGVKRAINQIIL